jgi:O-methyltransferase
LQAAQLFPENLRVTAEAVWLALWQGSIEEAARRLEMAEARCRGTAPAPDGIELARNVLARLSRSDSPTLNRLSRQRAAEAIYFPRAPETSVPSRIELHAFAARYIGTDRPVRLLEFGVAGGASILGFGKLFTHPDSRFTGFDSFRGLPEQWHDKPAGTFSMAGKTPITDDPRIDFVSGWFQDTLPGFLSQLPASESRERTILVHFDADLYSATLFVLTMLWNVFDNYYFITDELYLDEVVALYDFVRSYPTQLEFYARAGGGSGVPLYAFGRLRRVGFDEAIKIGG